jgi:P27 family predicted phage terminase small subunit
LEVVSLDNVPAEPSGFDSVASLVWSQLWRAGRKHLSNDSDFVLMALLCSKIAERTQLADWLAEDFSRRFYETANGQIVSHPAVKQIDQYDAQITSWLSMLGFSPSDRARLGLAEVRIADALDQFRQRKQDAGG